jgi:hypothetical protein
MTKIAGSGSISQRHGSADPDPDPDPPRNVMDPEHWQYMYMNLYSLMILSPLTPRYPTTQRTFDKLQIASV